MKQEVENPKLSPGLRAAYRSTDVPEYLSRRVIANLKPGRPPVISHPLTAGALVCALVLAILLFKHDQQGETRQESDVASMTSLADLSRFAAVHDAVNTMRIPGLSSLNNLPVPNQLTTPHSSQYSPGQICLYQPQGERKC